MHARQTSNVPMESVSLDSLYVTITMAMTVAIGRMSIASSRM